MIPFVPAICALQHDKYLAERSVIAIGPYGTCPAPAITLYTTVFGVLGEDTTTSTKKVPSVIQFTMVSTRKESESSVKSPLSSASAPVQIEPPVEVSVFSEPVDGLQAHTVFLYLFRHFPRLASTYLSPQASVRLKHHPTFPSIAEVVNIISGDNTPPLVTDKALPAGTVTDLDDPVILGAVQKVGSSVFGDTLGDPGDGTDDPGPSDDENNGRSAGELEARQVTCQHDSYDDTIVVVITGVVRSGTGIRPIIYMPVIAVDCSTVRSNSMTLSNGNLIMNGCHLRFVPPDLNLFDCMPDTYPAAGSYFGEISPQWRADGVSFRDGLLVWKPSDLGTEATFWKCSTGPIIASWQGTVNGCSQISLGGAQASATANERRLLARQANANCPASSSTSTVKSSTGCNDEVHLSLKYTMLTFGHSNRQSRIVLATFLTRLRECQATNAFLVQAVEAWQTLHQIIPTTRCQNLVRQTWMVI